MPKNMTTIIDGIPYRYPTTKKEAIELGYGKYSDKGNTCPDCGTHHPSRYVINDQCAVCLGQKLAVPLCEKGPHALKKVGNKCMNCPPSSRQAAIRAGKVWYLPTNPCKKCLTVSLKRVSDGWCKGCGSTAPRVLSPRQAAIAAGETWYMPDIDCPRCGTRSLKRVDNGLCQGCTVIRPQTLSPRQAAIAAGETWYMPDIDCPRCGTRSLKRVDNGLCQGCKPFKIKAPAEVLKDLKQVVQIGLLSNPNINPINRDKLLKWSVE